MKMGEEENKSPRSLIRRFYALQEERISTYSLFEEGFQAYLKGAPNYNFPMYRDLVNQITQAFQGISQEIITIEAGLKEEPFQMNQLASIINKIQVRERTKLEQTAQLQILQQNVVDHPDVDYSEELQDKKRSIAECMETIVELMDDLKYESEDLYTDVDDS